MNEVTHQCRERGHHKLSVVWSSLGEDILRFLNKSPENRAVGDHLKSRVGAFLTPNLLSLCLYRMAHWLYATDRRRWATAFTRFNFLMHKVCIPAQSCIGPGCFLPHPAGLTFCGRAGRGLTLYAQCICCPREPFPDPPLESGPWLGDDVQVGGGAVVLGPIRVGSRTKILAAMCLNTDAPPEVLAVSRVLRPTIRPLRAATGGAAAA